jgi:hypothetical protein
MLKKLSILLLLGILAHPNAYSQEVFYPTDDAGLYMRVPDGNYGSCVSLWVRNRHGHPSHPDNFENDIVIKFDLSTIPRNTVILSATLYMFYFDYKDNNPAGHNLILHRLSEDWDETTITWNNQPAHVSMESAGSSVPPAPGWMDWDVTIDAQDFIAHPKKNFGWILMDENFWGDFDIPISKFYTKEFGSYIPYLIIETDSAVHERTTHELLPKENRLYPNYPNPFNPSTQITYSLANTAEVTLRVFDILGREVAVLAHGLQSPGTYQVHFDASNLPSGVYFMSLKAGDFGATRKIVLTK